MMLVIVVSQSYTFKALILKLKLITEGVRKWKNSQAFFSRNGGIPRVSVIQSQNYLKNDEEKNILIEGEKK
ncbi:MAG: hypothetical protein V1915_02335 [Candidatus Bathyarchaeota archaeon]